MNQRDYQNDKYNISVTRDVYNILRSDAELFEFFKKSGTVVMNRFITALIKNYYELYINENVQLEEKIRQSLRNTLPENADIDRVAADIMQNAILNEAGTYRKKKPVKIPYKSTSDTNIIIDTISGEYSVAPFLGAMFTAYAGKPFSARERIIFKPVFDTISRAISEKTVVELSHRADPGRSHRILPYRIDSGTQEFYNYVIGQEIVRDENGNETAKTITYRLNRIQSAWKMDSSAEMDENVRLHLRKMLRYGPQDAINSDEIILVKLSPEAEKLFWLIYRERPVILEKKEAEDGNVIYSFDCSASQAFKYFRRFGEGVEILAPERLREQMIRFHSGALAPYTGSPENP